jgi:hypothetical protein
MRGCSSARQRVRSTRFVRRQLAFRSATDRKALGTRLPDEGRERRQFQSDHELPATIPGSKSTQSSIIPRCTGFVTPCGM